MNKGIEASREMPRFTCPKIFLNEFYAPMCRQVVDSAAAKVIHDHNLAAASAIAGASESVRPGIIGACK